MNYRHHFHAGNFADVVKHVVLTLILERLGRKPAPFFVLDTHAGVGCYDLTSAAALRTREAESGIGKLLTAWSDGTPAPAALNSYRAAVTAINPKPAAETGLRWYPGSPRITRTLMRPNDRLVLVEAHPDDAVALKREFAGDAQVAVHHQDGYGALKAHLPPRERRGLVLIDPPYETPDEAERLVAGLVAGYRRWPTGCYALWYPIKEQAWVWRLHESLAAAGIPRILVSELTLYPKDEWRRLIGCGMIIVNAPWQLDTDLSELLPWLHTALGGRGGGVNIEWLVGEATVETPTHTKAC